MAAKSDFAQKLLHDLRIRKERMAASHTSTAPRGAYRNPGNMQRGSRQTKSLESIGGQNQQLIMSSGGRGSSQQIVSYGHQRSESVGDLSMAFTYAGGKLVNMDFSGSGNTNTMIDFLQQIGRRSLDAGNGTSLVKHRPSNATPALTTIQIKEISKGVQNLYEILRSSTNGMNVSMEVGKELLKGARGLEESLRMLVNLQEASEMMVSPQRQGKSRITLLEVDEDNVDDRPKIVDNNQVALPRFSFDKPSKKPNLPLTDVPSKLPTHRRSASCGAESVRSVSTVKNSPSRPEKGRISNVIAKLMGLEEVPGKVDTHSKPDESKNTEPRIGLLAEKQVNKIPRPVKDDFVSLNNRKPQQSQDSNTNGVPRLPRTGAITVTKQSNNNRSDQLPERHNSNGEMKSKSQQKRRSSAVAVNLQQERVEKKKTIRTEKSNEIRLATRDSRMQEPERRTQKSKQDSQQIKHGHNQIKPKDSSSEEPQTRPSEGNLKVKDATPKAQESQIERTQGNLQALVVKEKPVARKKVDSVAVHRTEACRTRDEVVKRRINGSLHNLEMPSKHKLSLLKETKIKDVQPIQLKPEEISSRRSNWNRSESTTTARLDENITNKISDHIPIIKNDIKREEVLETVAASKYVSSDRLMENGKLFEKKPKQAFYSSVQVVLTEEEKQLKEILIKDQLFLSTAEALFKLNIPVGFLHADDHNHHGDETKLKLDCGYEILRRKARSQELYVHPYVKPSAGCTTVRLLDELVKQLYKDFESLRSYGRKAEREDDELHHMLERDIHNISPDTNSFWDMGWHTRTFTYVEKDEFVNDVEEEVVHRLVDEMVEDLVSVGLAF